MHMLMLPASCAGLPNILSYRLTKRKSSRREVILCSHLSHDLLPLAHSLVRVGSWHDMSDLLSPALLLACLQWVAGHVREVVGGHAAEALVHCWRRAKAVVPLLLLLGVAEGGALVCLAVGR